MFWRDEEAINQAMNEALAAGEPSNEMLAELSTDGEGGWHRTAALLKVQHFAHAGRSNKHYQRFLQAASKMIHLPNETRRSSWMTIIEDAFHLRPAIMNYIAEHCELHYLNIELADW